MVILVQHVALIYMINSLRDHSKMERLSNGPYTGSAFAESLRGINHFQDFKKANFRL